MSYTISQEACEACVVIIADEIYVCFKFAQMVFLLWLLLFLTFKIQPYVLMID